jgi:hypothetical protein
MRGRWGHPCCSLKSHKCPTNVTQQTLVGCVSVPGLGDHPTHAPQTPHNRHLCVAHRRTAPRLIQHSSHRRRTADAVGHLTASMLFVNPTSVTRAPHNRHLWDACRGPCGFAIPRTSHGRPICAPAPCGPVCPVGSFSQCGQRADRKKHASDGGERCARGEMGAGQAGSGRPGRLREVARQRWRAAIDGARRPSMSEGLTSRPRGPGGLRGAGVQPVERARGASGEGRAGRSG